MPDGQEAGKHRKDDGQEAEQPGKDAAGRKSARPQGAAGRKGTKPQSGEKRPKGKTVRVQLHLGEQTVERLGVHCSLAHRDRSAMADYILRIWLARNGKGKELFPAEPETPADQEDPPR